MSGHLRWTTRTRLIVTVAGVVSAVILATAAIGIFAVRHYVQNRVDTRLTAAAERLRASLTDLPDLNISSSTIGTMARAQSVIVVVVDASGRSALAENADPRTADTLTSTDLRDGRPHRVPGHVRLTAIELDTRGTGLTMQTDSGSRPAAAIVIAVDATNDLNTVQTLVAATTAGVLTSIAVLVLLTIVVVDRGLRPLTAMSERVRAFARGDRSARLPVPRDDPDIAHLAETVNQAFQAQQEAESRLRAFVADASHELRTPLTIASGWVELYLQGGLDDPDERNHALQRAAAQLGKMRVLIDELALLARLDRDRPLDLQPLDLAALTAEVVADIRVMNPDRAFVFDQPGPAIVLAEPPKLHQVLVNVLGNAVQHTPSNTSVEVSITCAQDAADTGGTQVLQVTDHGPGIPQQDQPHIFERFWRGDASRDRHTGGSGLGLAIVASIVHAHGGTATVDSRDGRGTTIRIELPQWRPHDHTNPRPSLRDGL